MKKSTGNSRESRRENTMGKSSEENSEEEKKEECVAALCLTSFKHVKLDNQTAQKLNRMKQRILDGLELDPDDDSGSDPDSSDSGPDPDDDPTQIRIERYLPVNEAFRRAILQGRLNPRLTQMGRPIDGITLPRFPPMENLRAQIGECTDPFEKQLTTSDVKDDQSRLSIPKELVGLIDGILNEEEITGSKSLEGIQVTGYDWMLNQFPMKFKKWGSKLHVLTSGWKDFYHANGFQAHEDWVTIWVFRHREHGGICFVIMGRRFPILVRLQEERRQCISQNENGKRN